MRVAQTRDPIVFLRSFLFAAEPLLGRVLNSTSCSPKRSQIQGRLGGAQFTEIGPGNIVLVATMNSQNPIRKLPTHEVTNQSPALQDYDAYSGDPALVRVVEKAQGHWATDRLRAFGQGVGSARLIEAGDLANRHTPELRTFDRAGHRLDEVEFHPAYHELMQHCFGSGMHSIAWTEKRPGAHVAHAAMVYLMAQVETGVCCPVAMTYAVVPALRHSPEVAAEWLPGVLVEDYDRSFAPKGGKRALTLGMAMTEKQGGSDVRSNTTVARPIVSEGSGHEYLLTGHKWFCSAPMSDAFLTLAQTRSGLSCFLVPRWRPDGTRNNFFIQRLKNKLGNRSNASSEIEYHDTWALMIGAEGEGVRTIIEMVHHTRLDAATAPAGLMRQAVLQGVHHASHRKAFGRRLIEQPLMGNVLADMTLETEAALMLSMSVAEAFDAAESDSSARAFGRVATAVAKYWTNKRTPNLVYEAMESLGGAGYVEESILPRIYREAPVNSIWEGSGNVICLDVLRSLSRDPDSFEAFFARIAAAPPHPLVSRGVEKLKDLLGRPAELPVAARRVTESMAVLLQATLFLEQGVAEHAELFCRTRLGDEGGAAYGTLPADADWKSVLRHGFPQVGV